MELLQSIVEFEIIGNKLWRIFALFGIILMAFSEYFNKEVFRRFNEEGIDFAFPTQTLYLAGDPSRPLTVGVRGETSSPHT